MSVRVALVPGVLALLPEYAGLVDPVAELRAACLDAVTWLGAEPGTDGHGFGVRGSPQGLRLARHLAERTGVPLDLVAERPSALLVVGNGSATRSERAPGHLDVRAEAFDAALRDSLRSGGLDEVDRRLGRELWADVDSLARLGRQVRLDAGSTVFDYDDAPFGVQYWVTRWTGEWR